MASNIIADTFTVVYPAASMSFAAAGLNASNTLVLYEIGKPTRSWDPARTLNTLATLTVGKGYMIKTKVSMENLNFYPPFPVTGGGSSLPFTLA